MNEPIPYEALIRVLADCVHDHWPYDTWNGQTKFSHNFASQFQIAAAVLDAVDILKPITPGKDGLVLTCAPEEFERRALSNRSTGLDYEILVLAIFGMAERGYDDDEKLIDCLTRLKLYEIAPDGRLISGENYDKYNQLGKNWASLISI